MRHNVKCFLLHANYSKFEFINCHLQGKTKHIPYQARLVYLTFNRCKSRLSFLSFTSIMQQCHRLVRRCLFTELISFNVFGL